MLCLKLFISGLKTTELNPVRVMAGFLPAFCRVAGRVFFILAAGARSVYGYELRGEVSFGCPGWTQETAPVMYQVREQGFPPRVPAYDGTLTVFLVPGNPARGVFTIPGIPDGTYEVALKHYNHLADARENVIVAGGDVTGIAFTLWAGDADGDNKISSVFPSDPEGDNDLDICDYRTLYYSNRNSLAVTAGRNADFDGDGKADYQDYLGLGYGGRQNRNPGNWYFDTVPPAPPAGPAAVPDGTAIDLSWNANTETDLAGYNVYRSPNRGGPYAKITPGPVAGVNHRDADAPAGVICYYVITAFDRAGNESERSSEVGAENVAETEPNGDFAAADPVAPDSAVAAAVYPKGDNDYFKFNVSGDGQLNVSLTNAAAEIDAVVAVYDSSRVQIAYQYGGGSGRSVVLSSVELPSGGDYYLHIYDNGNNDGSPTPYRLQAIFAANTDSDEPNDDFAAAAAGVPGRTVTPTIFPRGDNDYFKINLSRGGRLNISVTEVAVELDAVAVVYDSSRNQIAYQYGGGCGKNVILPPLELATGGDYYLRIYDNGNNAGSLTPYRLRVDFEVNPDAGEPNDTFAGAAVYTAGRTVTPTIFPRGDQDYFKFTSSRKGLLVVDVTGFPPDIDADVYVYDSGCREIGSSYGGGKGRDVNFELELPSAGEYYLRVLDSGNDADSLNQYQLRAELYGLWIKNVSDAPDPFSPDNDLAGDSTTISAVVNASSNWAVDVKDSAGVLRRAFAGTGTEISRIWDGKDESGAVANDGVYTYVVSAQDPVAGAAAPVSGTVTVDTVPPAIEIIQPRDGETVAVTVAVLGTAFDTNFSGYLVQCGAGPAPSSWTTIANSSSPVTAGLLATWLTDVFPNGACTLKLSAIDKAGHVSVRTQAVTLDNVKITSVSAAPATIDPLAGEQVTISYVLDRDAAVTLEIYDEKTRTVVSRLVNNRPRPGGMNQEKWDGKDDSGNVLPPEAYYFRISAEDGATGRGRFLDDYTSPATENRMIDAGKLDPYRNQPARIGWDMSQPGRLSMKITGGGGDVQTLFENRPFARGHQVAYWDGYRDDGTRASGAFNVYFGVPAGLPRNAIILEYRSLDVTAVSCEAFLIIPTYGEISSIKYVLTRDVRTEIEIIDPNGSHFRTLLPSTPQAAGSYSIEWDGTADDGKLVSVEGDYAVKIIAADPVSGLTVTRNGTIAAFK